MVEISEKFDFRPARTRKRDFRSFLKRLILNSFKFPFEWYMRHIPLDLWCRSFWSLKMAENKKDPPR